VLAAAAVLTLAPGITELKEPLRVPVATHVVQSAPGGSTLRAAAGFRGAALLLAEDCRGLRVEGVSFDGNRAAFGEKRGLPPYDRTFADFTPWNGVLVRRCEDVTLTGLKLREIAGFAVLVSASRRVTVEGIEVRDSGSRNAQGRNNTTGGVLIEDGASGFTVRGSRFLRVLGNGVWTHSRFEAPRNADGVIEDNTLEEIARDAIQAGHATRLTVRRNTIARVGWPEEAVDVEGGGTPVGIDTAGNVDLSHYTANRMAEINGKCIDLDGFHHGSVTLNTCVNARGPASYAFGHYGIVFNNTNPQMRSEAVLVARNEFRGLKYGAVFLVGRNHRVVNNRFLDLNRAGCPDNGGRFACTYFAGEPELLSAGIYLGARAEREDPSAEHVIADNVVTGHGMKERCVAAAPGVRREASVVARNQCGTR
jgi:hypothetical protein